MGNKPREIRNPFLGEKMFCCDFSLGEAKADYYEVFEEGELTGRFLDKGNMMRFLRDREALVVWKEGDGEIMRFRSEKGELVGMI